jgi:hypothetical protein
MVLDSRAVLLDPDDYPGVRLPTLGWDQEDGDGKWHEFNRN